MIKVSGECVRMRAIDDDFFFSQRRARVVYFLDGRRTTRAASAVIPVIHHVSFCSSERACACSIFDSCGHIHQTDPDCAQRVRDVA